MDPNKAYSDDGVSVRILKLSFPTVTKPLLIIFCNYLNFEAFPDDWKKGNIVPVHKKDNKEIVNKEIILYPCCLYASKFLKSSLLMLA